MRCLFLFLLVVVIGCCSGCDNWDELHNAQMIRAQKKNATAVSKGGAIVGKLPDGRALKVIEIDDGFSRTHFVYIVDGARSVSTNRLERSGKTDVVKTEAVVGE